MATIPMNIIRVKDTTPCGYHYESTCGRIQVARDYSADIWIVYDLGVVVETYGFASNAIAHAEVILAG